MSKRKSLDVQKLVAEVNRRNKESTCKPGVREGWNSLLEEVLHETGNYAGFGYYTIEEVPAGELPGIVRSERGNVFPDDTRRFYYHR